MSEDYKEVCAITDKLWAYFVGLSWDRNEADEFILDVEKLRKFLKIKMFEFAREGMKSSSLLLQRGEEHDS